MHTLSGIEKSMDPTVVFGANVEIIIPKEYWNINGEFSMNNIQYSAKLHEIDGVSGKDLVISNSDEASKAQNELESLKYKVNSVKSSTRKTKPRPPLTTSSLQQDA